MAAACRDKVKTEPLAVHSTRAWLKQREPDWTSVNVIDISFVVDAAKNFPYPQGFLPVFCPCGDEARIAADIDGEVLVKFQFASSISSSSVQT